MTFALEDLTCKDCGIHWSEDNDQWFLQFTTDRLPGKNVLLWAQCPACQAPEDRFAADVARDIHYLPLTDHD